MIERREPGDTDGPRTRPSRNSRARRPEKPADCLYLSGGPDGLTGPGQRVEGAVDGGLGDIGQAEVAVPGIGP